MQPPLHVGEALSAGDVVDHDDPVGPPVVGAGDGPEPLLAGRVPDLQLDSLSIEFYGPDLEVHTWRVNTQINTAALSPVSTLH